MGTLSTVVATFVGEVAKPIITPIVAKGKEFVDHVKEDMKAIEERKAKGHTQPNPHGWTEDEMRRAKALLDAEKKTR